MSESIDIRPVKEKAMKLGEPLKSLILSEPDLMSKEDYFAKSETWLKLLQIGGPENTGIRH